MCSHPLAQAALIFAFAALAIVLALFISRIDARRTLRREFERRKEVILAEFERREQAQHFWRNAPAEERRG